MKLLHAALDGLANLIESLIASIAVRVEAEWPVGVLNARAQKKKTQ